MIANESKATVDNHRIIGALTEFPKGTNKAQTRGQQSTILTDESPDASHLLRETGDQVNGFMLCALVSQSAKRVKGRAERVGTSLPMSIITRSILNAYLIAAKDHEGPFMNAKPDMLMIRKLNEQVLQELLARHNRDRANHNRAAESVRR